MSCKIWQHRYPGCPECVKELAAEQAAERAAGLPAASPSRTRYRQKARRVWRWRFAVEILEPRSARR